MQELSYFTVTVTTGTKRLGKIRHEAFRYLYSKIRYSARWANGSAQLSAAVDEQLRM